MEAQGKDETERGKTRKREEKDTINLHSIVTYIPPEESIDDYCFRHQKTNHRTRF